ncbi:MAG: hypothetical protein O3C21_16810, partial [Verrucomicrobia bacterium]|nr:hypothetical protein [Verrucomicrobiota bacterium]
MQGEAHFSAAWAFASPDMTYSAQVLSHTSPDQPLPRSHYLLVLVAGVLAHGLSLRAQFYMDDYMHLIGNARVMEGEGLFSWSRLLPYLAYFLIYKVAGFSAIAFHGLNLLIHLALSGFVLWSMRDFERYLLPPSASEKT